MRKRSTAIGVLVVSLLVSAWGNVIAASFCPRYGMSHEGCFINPPHKTMPVEQKPSCHHEMADMNSEGTDEILLNSSEHSDSDVESMTEALPLLLPTVVSSEAFAVDDPTQTCGHCCRHSQPASGSSTLGMLDPSLRLPENLAASTDLIVALPPEFSVTIAPSEHGPPGNALPRHVLISVFRI